MTKELNSLNEVYQTIAKITSLEDALLMYQEFKGLTITFPTKLLSTDYVKQYLRKETLNKDPLSSRDIQLLARKFDYSERHIRRFLSEIKQDKSFNKIKDEELIYITKWMEQSQVKEDWKK